MSYKDCNKKRRKGKHLTYEEKIKLEALYKLKLSPAKIGEHLGGRNRRTIEREIAKGLVDLQNSDLTTRKELIFKIKSKTQSEVIKVLNHLEKENMVTNLVKYLKL